VSSIDELFALPPSEFVAARDGLAKRLRAEGDREGAQQVRELRRPTVPAWAVNQLVRQDAAGLEGLLAAGSELQEAQRQALAGSRDAGLREATTRRRELIDDLTGRAADILSGSGTNPDPHRDAIAATLEAATLDGDAAEKVRSGRLSKELPAPAGFGDLGDLGGFVVVDEPEPAPSKTKEDRAERRAEARRAVKLAQERADEAERAAGEARREAEAQMRSAQKALEKADRARQEADRLAEEARQAREQLADLSG
jgi:hypothetical protein